MIDFAQPTYFLLGVLALVMAAGSLSAAIWRRRARDDLAGPQASRWGDLGFWLRSLLIIAAAGLITIAAARPQWGATETVREVSGVDYVIALDVSKSMNADDVAPTRLAAAQEELIRLVESERGSRIGLVLFAGDAFLRSPLTSDTRAMAQLIRRAGQETSLIRLGSDLGAALDVAGVILTASEDDRGKAVILISDGEDHADTYIAAAEALASRGITVLAAGVGTPGGALLYDTAPGGVLLPKLGAGGQPIVSRLDESSLMRITEATGGRYERVSGDARSLLSLQIDLQSLDTTPAGSERSIIPTERYQLFAAAAIGLVLLAWFLPPRLRLPRLRRARPHPALALLLLALTLGACQGNDEGSLQARNREANALFAAGDYPAALALYQELLAERPDVDELSFNAGNALHRLESYERAISTTSRGLPPRDAGLGVATYYALGNHFLRLGRYEEAYIAYREALLLDSGDLDAKHNLELVLRLASSSQPPPGQPPPGEGAQGPPQGEPGGEGEATPAPGGQESPSGDPDPDATLQAGTPEPGQVGGSDLPGTPQASPAPGASVERTLAEALAGIDDEVTFEEAIEILDLLRQRQRTPGQAARGPSSGPDY